MRLCAGLIPGRSAVDVTATVVSTARQRRYRHGVDRRFLRPGWVVGHLLVFAAVLTCLRLGWWQWERTQETTGTAQNFGYALLWPGFGVAFIYMWLRFLHLEVIKDAEDDEETDREIRELLEASDDPQRRVDPADSVATDRPTASPATGTSSGPDEPDVVDAGADRDPETAQDDADVPTDPAGRGTRRPDLQRPSRGVTIAVAMVGEEDDDDPELTAYNRALAALAEEDRRRAR